MSVGGVREFKNLFDGETEYHYSATGLSHINKLLVSKTKTLLFLLLICDMIYFLGQLIKLNKSTH